MTEFDRITFDVNVIGGRATIAGMRVTVSFIVNLVANGMNSKEIIEAYPHLELGYVCQSQSDPLDHREVSKYSSQGCRLWAASLENGRWETGKW
jgi:uncharacterized protein (DUF433 family)